jgi:AcrR family transcriptional regulator
MPRSADRKLLIRQAATALFARKGYDATTLAEVAQGWRRSRRAGGGRAGGRLLGRQPDELLWIETPLALAVRESIVSALADAIGAALTKHPEAIGGAVAAVHAAYLDWVIASPERAALLRDLAGVRVVSQGANEGVLARVSEVLERWAVPLMARGTLAIMAPELLLAVILGPVVILSWSAAPSRLQALVCTGVMETLTGLTLNGLHSGPKEARLRSGRRPIQREAKTLPAVASRKATRQMALGLPVPE